MRKQQQQSSNNEKQEINQKTSQRSGTSVRRDGGRSKAGKEGWSEIIVIKFQPLQILIQPSKC